MNEQNADGQEAKAKLAPAGGNMTAVAWRSECWRRQLAEQ